MTDVPFVAGSDTSADAAASMVPHAGAARARVFGVIASAGSRGATSDEVEAETGMRHQTASARVVELRNAKAIVDSGERRKTRSGRRAVVYVACR